MTSAAAVQATAAVVTAGGIASLTYLAGSAGLAASRVNPDTPGQRLRLRK